LFLSLFLWILDLSALLVLLLIFDLIVFALITTDEDLQRLGYKRGQLILGLKIMAVAVAGTIIGLAIARRLTLFIGLITVPGVLLWDLIIFSRAVVTVTKLNFRCARISRNCMPCSKFLDFYCFQDHS